MKKSIGILTVFLLVIYYSFGTYAKIPHEGSIYCRNPSHSKQIALTFDDGPHPRYTAEILSILEEYEILATFFIIGVNAERYPDALKEIASSGCEIGNHTYSHAKLSNLSIEDIQREMEQCQSVLWNLIGVRSALFRPPQGATSSNVKLVCQKTKQDIILWSIDTLDWALMPSRDIAKTVMEQVKGGDIILMHDYVSGGNTTCEALRIIIPQLLAAGYEFVTVSQLIS